MKATAHYASLTIGGKTVVLRPINSNDLDSLLAFVNGLVKDKRRGKGREVFTGFEEKISRREEADWLAKRLDAIRNRDTVSVVAETDNQIVANGDVTRGHYKESRHHGHLGLTVVASYRGIGLGKVMVKVLLREARRIGVKNLDVEFLSTNQAAIHTYLAAGFKQVGGIPRAVHRSGKFVDSMIMARDI